MGNGISSDKVPNVSWEILHNEIKLLGEDEEIGLDDHENGFANFKRCRKSRGHSHMTPILEPWWTQLPQEWRDPSVVNAIARRAAQTVKITVPYVSVNRPPGRFLRDYRGTWVKSVGSGLAYIDDSLLHQAPIDCPIAGCKRGPRNHKVTPMFSVTTAKHVIYDNTEAGLVTLIFFYDQNCKDFSSVVEGQGVDIMVSVGYSADGSTLRAVSHDLDLFKKVTLYTIACSLWARRSLRSHSLPISEPEKKSHLVVVTSHPHGLPKYVSFGELVDVGEMVDVVKLMDFSEQIGELVNVGGLAGGLENVEGLIGELENVGGLVRELLNDWSLADFCELFGKGVGELVDVGELMDVGKRETYGGGSKLVDLIKFIESIWPEWRENGMTLPKGFYFSPDTIMDFVTAARDDPTITFRQYYQRLTLDFSLEHFPSMSHTAATCPGSSGAGVTVWSMRDGEMSLGVGAIHSRQSGRFVGDRHVNISGGGCVLRSEWEFLHSICEEKNKDQ